MTERKFIPGSEWLYLKIYTGIKTSDVILEEVIQPLTEYFQENDFITKWFFIRYNDPKSHLRIRFLLNDIENYARLMTKIKTVLQEYVDSGEISNILVHTYNREIERYEKKTIEDAEALFHRNSEFTLQCLGYDDEEKIMISLLYIDEILSKINLSVQERLDWVKDFNDSFKREFNADKKLNSQLDKKYRDFKPKFLNFIQSEEFSGERNAVILNVEQSNVAIQNIVQHNQNNSLEMSLQSFFQSTFHMNVNRFFVSDQRLFEMVIYDYAVRYYKMKLYYKKKIK